MLRRALTALTRCYPFNTPRARLLRMLPGVPADHVSTAAKWGVRFARLFPGHDHISKSIYWFGDFDPWVVRTLLQLAAKGDAICDVGANIGDTALPLALRVGPNGSVFCFEPVPENVMFLRANIAVNSLKNVIVCPFALSDRRLEASMFVPVAQPGMARIVRDTDNAREIHVKAIPFDEWVKEIGAERIDICKLDVEGHEAEVLRGMTNTLRAGRIGAFVFEHHHKRGRSDEVIQTLVASGYRVLRICKGIRSTHYVPPGQRPKGALTSDWVAVLEGSRYEERLLGKREELA